ncbi:MAG: nSTAND1 domain-containing NTPase [Planctomycetota bacterium]|jgi:hypothetical protein
MKTAARYLWQLRYYLVAVATTIVAFVVVTSKSRGLGSYAWVAVGIGLLPLVAAFIFESLPEWRARRRAKKLAEWEITDESLKVGFFRIGPFEEVPRDIKDFHRADQAHEEVFQWLERSTLPVLILTGYSGTGKSSLLNAYVIPQLREATPCVKPITLRSFDDPIAALSEELLKAGVVWSKPHKALVGLDAISLLRKACEHLSRKGKRLLLVFDQFEELLEVHRLTGGAIEATKAFLKAVQDDLLPGLTVLLSLRFESTDMLEQFELPRLEKGRNWLNIYAFTTTAATEYLKKSGLKLGEKRLQSILDEAGSYEREPGRVRPITLNMLGALLERSPTLISEEYVPGSLLLTDLRNRIERSEVRDEAANLLRNMLEGAKKKPCSVGYLAKKTHLAPKVVEGCLLELSSDGIVRPINRDVGLSEHIWEISHGFVAHFLSRVLEARRTSLWQRTRPMMAPISIVIWVVGFAFLLPAHLRGGPARAADELRSRFLMRVRPTAEGWELGLEGSDIQTLHEMAPLLRRLGKVKSLELHSCLGLKNLDALKGLPQMKTFNLSMCVALENLDVLKWLTQLQTLSLAWCTALDNLDGLEGLTQLRTLQIRACDVLKNLDVLKGLTQLNYLYINDCDDLKDFDGLKGLTQLRTLDLSYCDALENVDVLKGLTQLQILDLSYCGALKNIDGLKGLTQVHMLHLSGCSALKSVDSLKGLTQLKTLDLSSCDALSAAQVADLRRALPDTSINSD